MCQKCHDARRGNIEYFDILQGVTQGCTLSPTLFKVFINDLILAIESAQQGVKVGDDMVSGLMLRMTLWGFQDLTLTPDKVRFKKNSQIRYTLAKSGLEMVCGSRRREVVFRMAISPG